MNKVWKFVFYSFVVWAIVSLLTPHLNSFFRSTFGSKAAKINCETLWNINDPTWQRILYQICLATKDQEVSETETRALVGTFGTLFPSFFSDSFYLDPKFQQTKSFYETNFAVDSYIRSIRTERFVRQDKPPEFFEDIDREFNEYQKVLLEQARYYEYPQDGSNAQKLLGSQRGLEYVGLHFPYGSQLETE